MGSILRAFNRLAITFLCFLQFPRTFTRDLDEKILCVPEKDPRYANVKSLEDVPAHRLEEIAEFFRTYKNLEKKVTEINGWERLYAVNNLVAEYIAAAKK